jgi:fatty-acyl-CoA synthase
VAELTAPGPGATDIPALSELPGLSAVAADAANILYTSGTTGRPKGAMQTHGNLVFNAGTVGSVFAVTATDRTLVVAPMFHATGIVSQLVGFGAHGAARVFQPRFRAADMREALTEHRITFFAGVTAMIHLMLADPAFDPAGLPALRTICFGGAPVAQAFMDEAVRRLPGVTFANVWGLTEATSIVTCALGPQWLDRPWSVGRAVPGVDVTVAVDGKALAAPDPDAVGELWVRGPVVTAGYWNRPEATAETFGADGWLRTGDVGRADADGYVQVLDRMKDMIIRGGENIYSLEVEGVLARHPDIVEVAVLGVPDPLFGERVRAVVVISPGAGLSVEELRGWAASQLADYKLPAEMVTVDALPRNASGKVIKKQLSSLPLAGDRAPAKNRVSPGERR